MAAREGKFEIVKIYISMNNGVDIDCAMDDGWTPFFYAAVNGYLLTVDILYEAGAFIDAVDKVTF